MPPHRNAPVGRTGHVSISYKDRVYVWGGYKENHEDHINTYFSPDEIWIYHCLTETWSNKKCTVVNGPSGMSGSTATVIDSCMYLFGGYCQDREGSVNHLYRLDLEKYSWERLHPGGQAPFPVDKTASWHHKGKFYTFGGFGSPTSLSMLSIGFQFVIDEGLGKGWTNQLFEYDPEINTWKIPPFEGELPVARAAHAAAVVSNKVFIFGGRHDRIRMNDMHCCDMNGKVFKWSGRINERGPVPEGRSWHSLTTVSDRFLLLYGGFSNYGEPLGDCWLFDVIALTWHLLQLQFYKCRLWHSASLTAYSEVMIFGGSSSNILDPRRVHEQADEIIFIRISPKSLFRICLDRVGELQELYPHWCTLPHSIQAILNIRHCTTKATSLDGS